MNVFQLNEMNVKTYVIAIGTNYSEEEVKIIASGDGDSTIFYATDVSHLRDSVRAIAVQLCEL